MSFGLYFSLFLFAMLIIIYYVNFLFLLNEGDFKNKKECLWA